MRVDEMNGCNLVDEEMRIHENETYTHLHDGAANVNGRRPYGRDEGRQYGRWGGTGG